MVVALMAAVPLSAFGQSAETVERCFQNPAACPSGGAATPPPAAAPAPVAAARSAPAPDYTTVLQSPEPDRRKLQESLRTLDKYNGPIDGDLRSDASSKAISEWQKGHGYTQAGKLTPTEAVTLNNEAAKAPIRRLDPSTQPTAAAAAPSNADLLKALQARRAAARKAAEPKAEAAAQALVKDVKAYVAADGKGVAGDQFPGFAKWYADSKSANLTIGGIAPSTEDYGQAKAGTATTTEVKFDVKQGDKNYGQCLLFAWIEATPRKNTQAFACDDVAAVEKWKSDQALKSDWR